MVNEEEKVPEVWVLAMATGDPPPDPPQTVSLECTSPECTVGDGGTRYKTPAYPLEYAMQMLVMHDNNNHRQPRPAQVVESSQNRKAEKVSRPTIKMGSSKDDFIFFQCLYESYKRSCQLTKVTNVRDPLLACCETDLRRDLHRRLNCLSRRLL